MNWLGRRNWVEAERAAVARLAEVPGDERTRADLAEALRRQGRLGDALAVCETGLELRPSARLYLRRALIEIELKQAQGAERSLASAVQVVEATGAEDPESLLVASEISEFLGHTGRALASAHRAVILAPQEPRFLAHLGRLLVDSDAPLAEQRLRQSLRLDPEQADVQNNLGAALLQQKKNEQAAEAFRAALALAPDYALAATNLLALDAAKRRRSAAFPLVMVPLLGSTWLAWTAVSFGREAQISWPRMGASLCLMLLGFLIGAIANRLQPRDALIQKIYSGLNEGRIADRRAAPVLLFSSRLLLGLGLPVMLGCPIGAFFLAREYWLSHSSNSLVGVGVLLAGSAVGALLVYESRNLNRQAARARDDRS